MAKEYTIRKKMLSLLGQKFYIYNSEGEVLGFCKQAAFKLKEDIRIYTSEAMDDERISIKARSIIDFSAAYDVIDSRTETKLGALKRMGMKSIFRDEWVVMDPEDYEIGKIKEDSGGMALLRRFVSNLIPQAFSMTDSDGEEMAEFRTHFNPFVYKMTVTIEDSCPLNPFMVLASGILLAAIEGRQN